MEEGLDDPHLSKNFIVGLRKSMEFLAGRTYSLTMKCNDRACLPQNLADEIVVWLR